MHLLHRALDEDKELQQIVASLSERTAENPLKHAIVLDLNPFWFACHRLSEMGLRSDLLFYHFGGPWNRFFRLNGGGGLIDLSKTFLVSKQLTSDCFGASENSSPYMLRIFARAVFEKEEIRFRQQLVEAARETPIATIVETQEPARLLAAPGDRITSPAPSFGTLGGFVKDSLTSKTFAMTCGHVISAGALASIPSGHLGSCIHADIPKPLPSGVICSSSCGFVTDLDVALIDVAGAPVTNVASSIATIISPGDSVTMNGAKSGVRHYEVGGAVVEHTIGGSCWTKLHLFHAPISVGILPVAVGVAATPPPDHGDSGAWLLRSGSEWAGMVVAGNALHGFALASTITLDQSDKSFGTRLQLA